MTEFRPFRPAGPDELEPYFLKWLSDSSVRDEIQTIMTLLGCEAWQAVLVRQLARSTSYLSDLVDAAEEEQDTWPGKPPNEQEG